MRTRPVYHLDREIGAAALVDRARDAVAIVGLTGQAIGSPLTQTIA